jgi:hypothetical protein
MRGAHVGADSAGPAKTAAMLRGVHRIVFLGDSITQAGDYVTDCECWLLARGFHVEILNLGLGSETVSDLTPKENAPHLKAFGFGRPVRERAAGPRSGGDQTGFALCLLWHERRRQPPAGCHRHRRFAKAITHLRDAAAKAGVKRVVICTPPVR